MTSSIFIDFTVTKSLFITIFRIKNTTLTYFIRGSIDCTPDLLFYRFGFKQTSKSVDNFNVTKQLNPSQ